MASAGGRTPPTLQRMATAIDRKPARGWSVQALHHGARILLLLAASLFVYLFFPAPRVQDTAVLERGVVAPEDVVAEFTFRIPKGEAELARERAEAAAGVPPVYDRLPGMADSVSRAVGVLFATVDSVARAADDDRAAVRALLEANRISPTPGTVGFLLNVERRRELERATLRAVRELYPMGILQSGTGEPAAAIRLRTAEQEERILPADSVLTAERFYALAAEYIPPRMGAEAAELQRLFLIRFTRPNVLRNEFETEAARARARAAVDPFQATVLQGEKIVGAREQIGDREEERLRAYRAALQERGMGERGGRPGRTAGAILFNTMMLGILGGLLWFFRREIYHDFRAVSLIAVLVVGVMGGAALVSQLNLPTEMIPVTFASLIVAVLWGGRLALVLTLVLAMLIAGQSPFLGITPAFAAAIGGAAAAFSVRIVQRRSQTWSFIMIISAAYVMAALTMGLLRSREAGEVFASMGAGVLNAVVASLLAIGFLPLFESFTRITTDQTLLELSDLVNRPLLKRLSLEAPGTYAHTLSVANLAEASCHAIGANGLLARVGVYYHDVGKLVKPQYFVENQPRGRNPHDKLKPATSAQIIRNHVTEGLRLAEDARLPAEIRAFILEHHGTQKISFFSERARQEEGEGAGQGAEFVYPGPKPQSKETAVVMLADSVESAARVLQDPDPLKIRALVDRIVAGKMEHGQLDEAPITLREISIVKEQLATVLMGMYHHRIDYPASAGGPPEDDADVAIAVAEETRHG
jgi:cyclic-di-AMP phosphodiesterase PgpH